MILVALAGGLGASLRLVTDGIVRSRVGDRLPWGTLLINIAGSAALGALLGISPGGRAVTVVGTGLIGGFTTFSTASFETAALALEQRRVAASGYAFGTLGLSVAAAALGYFLAASTAR